MTAVPKRGYVDWTPTRAVATVIEQAIAVLDEYREQLPLTVRQVFYRLVGAYEYPKADAAYKRLVRNLSLARRARIIPFEALRDDGLVAAGGDGYADAGDFWDAMRTAGGSYRRGRQQGQPQYIEVWCEAAGMVPQLVRAVGEYGVPVYSAGGFCGLTVIYDAARRVLARGVPTLLLHAGDYDPSGASIFTALTEDVFAFCSGHVDYAEDLFHAERIALTPEQVTAHALPTAPAKASDKRSKTWDGATCQLEALPPDALQRIVRDAVERNTDQAELGRLLNTEADERLAIQQRLEVALGGAA